MTTHPAPPPAAQTREPGWYWAKMTADSNWRPLLWQHGDWYDQPVGFAYVGPPFAEIGPRIPSPAERAIEPAVMAAAKEVEGLLAVPAERPGDAAPSRRPTTSNADEWVLWLEEWRDAGNSFLAVQIVEAIEEHQRALARQVYALREATKDECRDKDDAYHRGRYHEARSIARAINAIMPLSRDPTALAGELSPAPRDGGWNAAIEAAAKIVESQAYTDGDDGGTWNDACSVLPKRIRALAQPHAVILNNSAPMEKTMALTDEQIKHMVNRFLGWRLPEPWHPDGGIEFKPEFNVEYMASQGKPPMRHEPTGTNLFDYKQSTAMVRYMVEGMERASDAALGERLRALRAKATPGPWSVATYCLRPGSPDQIERGLLMYGDDEGDDVSPTGVIDEKDMPGIGEESVSHDLDLIAELVNNLDAILAALTPSAPGGGTGWRDISTAPRDGTRLILGWDDISSLPMHCEMGRFRSGTGPGSGWCNTYGHSFSGSPTHYMPLPSPPGAAEEDGR